MAGRFKAQESVVEAASREAREELGVVLAAKDLVAVTTMRRSQQTSLAI
ncbi:NUDIX domain-containing protein [Arthrobacter glacialis]|nr:NUDIX domain-containing protein [Arthrobacter glacialis]